MQVLALRHVGIIVNNLDMMIKFYAGLGFSSRKRELESNSFVRQLTRLDLLGLDTVKMYINQEGIASTEHNFPFVLELLKPVFYDENIYDAINANQKQKKGGQHLFEFGMHDLSLTVDDIDNVLEYIRTNSGHVLSGPLKPISQYAFPSLHSYCLDPEGNILHIVQNLKLQNND